MINFNSKNEGEWFQFIEGNEEAGSICLRVIGPEQYREIERLTVKTRKKVKKGVAYDDVTTNEKLAAKLRWRYCIVDWKNIQLDGVDLECTDENKVKLVENMDFLTIVGDFLEKLTEQNVALDEARLKNSGTSSDGDASPAE